MYTYQPTVFNQIFSLIKHQFGSLSGQLNTQGRVFNHESLLKVLLFAQMTGKESLRDLETGLQAESNKLYHIGLKSTSRSTISYRNNKVDPGIYEKLFYTIYNQYKSMFSSSIDLGIKCIAMDSTLISLALSMYDRAKYRSKKGGMRLHIGLDISECLPRFCVITDGKKGDNLIAKQIVADNKIQSGEMIVFDRYYVDFTLWKMIDQHQAYFVTRTKTNTQYQVIQEYTHKGAGIIYDAQIQLSGQHASEKYDQTLRIVRFYDIKSDTIYEFITNNFELSAEQIANIYQHRRSIETFFRRIKQNLKIKSFLGTSEHAVRNQIRVALIYFVLLRYLIESIKCGKQQALKLCRLIAQKCMDSIGISELYAICKSKTARCLTLTFHPPDSLFH